MQVFQIVRINMYKFDINLIFLNLPETHREVKEVCRVGKQYILIDSIKLQATSPLY